MALVHCNTNFFAIEFQCTSMFLASKLGKAKILIAKYAVTRCPYGQKFVLQRTSAQSKKFFHFRKIVFGNASSTQTRLLTFPTIPLNITLANQSMDN